MANTIHYWSYSGGAPSAADCASFADQLVNNAQSAFAGLMPTVWGVDAAMVVDLASSTGREATSGTPWLGTATGAALAPASATLINHQIGRRYRGGKPRTYLPIGTAADIASAGVWSGAHITAAASAWGDWVSLFISATSGTTTITAIVNVSYYGPPNKLVTGSTGRVKTVSTMRTTPIVDGIVAHSVHQNVTSQRRRNRDA